MAWVCLKHLFQNQNFGKLLDENASCRAIIPRGSQKYIKKAWLKELKQNLPLCDTPKKFMELIPKWSGPEWHLDSNGSLAMWAYVGNGKSINVIELDITAWLKKQSYAKLRTIASLAFWRWARHGCAYPLITQADLGDRAPGKSYMASGETQHDVPRQERFFEHLGMKRWT